MKTVEELVAHFGEQYRRLIELAMAFLDEKEPTWKLDEPINSVEYITAILERVS
jgi:hypothetical protein